MPGHPAAPEDMLWSPDGTRLLWPSFWDAYQRFRDTDVQTLDPATMSVVRTGNARYRVTVYDPFPPDSDPDETKAIYNTVLRINRFVEDRIREHPDQWFWMHNRWPKEAWVKAGVM